MSYQTHYRAGVTTSTTLQNADWSALRLLNSYRFFLIIAFSVVFYLSESHELLGHRNPPLFKYTHFFYLALALVFTTTIALRAPNLETQFYLHSYLDILCLATLMYASGGISSGLGILLVVQLAVIGHCAKGRFAAVFAAITTAVLLSQELYARSVYGVQESDLSQTALVCVTLFLVAFLTSVVLPHHIKTRTEGARPLTVRQIADLNSQIIAVLESGIMYVDSNNRVQLANEMALEFLGASESTLPLALPEVSPNLANALREWQTKSTSGNRPFTNNNNNLELLPGFSRLSDHGTLIKIEDHRQIKQQVQQLKLASLGRLSASIAHEIRNPLGAISNAVQLLGESEKLTEEDSRLIDIAENHTRRINRIIEDVMLLSRRKSARTEQLSLQQHLGQFQREFLEQHQLSESTLSVQDVANEYALFDSLHLHQILWNLCTNSITHNSIDNLEISIKCTRLASGSVCIEVADNGIGIPENNQASVFEPFFTTEECGTGLGLYIIRELCELNHASIEFMPQSNGACFRITMPSAQDMAA